MSCVARPRVLQVMQFVAAQVLQAFPQLDAPPMLEHGAAGCRNQAKASQFFASASRRSSSSGYAARALFQSGSTQRPNFRIVRLI